MFQDKMLQLFRKHHCGRDVWTASGNREVSKYSKCFCLTRWTTKWSCCRTAGANSSSLTTFSGRWSTPRRAPSYWSPVSRWVVFFATRLRFAPPTTTTLRSWGTRQPHNVSFKALLISSLRRSRRFIKNRLGRMDKYLGQQNNYFYTPATHTHIHTVTSAQMPLCCTSAGRWTNKRCFVFVVLQSFWCCWEPNPGFVSITTRGAVFFLMQIIILVCLFVFHSHAELDTKRTTEFIPIKVQFYGFSQTFLLDFPPLLSSHSASAVIEVFWVHGVKQS